MLTIPDGLWVRVWQSPLESTSMPASQVLEVPTDLNARYEGPLGNVQGVPKPLIVFGFGWQAHFAGSGFEDVSHMAARIAAHLAAASGEWPGAKVHVYSLPVVDTNFVYEASAVLRETAPPPSPAEVLAELGLSLEDLPA